MKEFQYLARSRQFGRRSKKSSEKRVKPSFLHKAPWGKESLQRMTFFLPKTNVALLGIDCPNQIN